MTQRELDIAIVTWKPEGILRLEAMNLPRVEGVRYVVSWQLAGDNPQVPEKLSSRPDVEVHLLERPGVSANRNNACRHCTAPVVLMGDDDLTYYPEALREVIRIFKETPDLDVAMFRHDGEDKYYPDASCRLGIPLPKGMTAAAVDLAVRREALQRVRFDEKFGPGAPVWQAAEDEKFLLDLRRAGMDCRYFPVSICCHDHPSTGLRAMTPGVAAAAGRYIRLEYPLSWIPRIFLKAWRDQRKGGKFLPTLRNMLRGAVSNGDK